jgi:NAD-dependent deacetylase
MAQPDIQSLIDEAASVWKQSSYPVAFTGAGISVPSGIPDFRSPGGLWTRFDPFEVATAEALDNNPRGVWEFMLETVLLLEKAGPNPAHLALAELEQSSRLMGVITQNIDNLHQEAGSEVVVEYHGNFKRFYCKDCEAEKPMDEVRALSQEAIPCICPSCGGLIRPDVVFFGESIPPAAHQQSLNMIARADLMLIVGTSGEVAPANVLPRQVKINGGRIIEINLGRTMYEDVTDIRFDGRVEDILPQLSRAVLS